MPLEDFGELLVSGEDLLIPEITTSVLVVVEHFGFWEFDPEVAVR